MVRIFLLVAIVVSITAILNAQEITPLSNVKDVIEQVKLSSDSFDSREGPFIIDTNIVYGPDPDDESDSPASAFDGTNHLIVWQDDRNGGWDIYGTRVDESGNVIDNLGIVISAAGGDQQFPAVAFDGADYFVVWEDDRNGNMDIYGARVTTSGNVLDPLGIKISFVSNDTSDQWRPSVAFGDTNYLVVWQDDRNVRWTDIYGARVDTSGAVIDTSNLVIAVIDSVYQRSPDVAFDGTNFFVAWSMKNIADWKEQVYATRINQSGNVLDSLYIEVFSTTGGFNGVLDPAIAFDGANFLVVWELFIEIYGMIDGNREEWWEMYLYGTRVDQMGVVLDTNVIGICTTDCHITSDQRIYPSLEFADSSYIVAWTDGWTVKDIRAQRVSQVGTLLGSPFNISTAVGDQYASSVAFGDTNYFVVWSDGRGGLSQDIYGARVTESGNVLDPAGIPISFTNDVANAQHEPTTSFDGTNYLIAWYDQYGHDIYGARVNPSGTVLDAQSIPISTSARKLTSPVSAFGDTNYFVVWKSFIEETWGYGSIRGARVSPSGVVLDPSGIQIAGPAHVWHPAIAFGDTNYLVALQANYYFQQILEYSRIVGTLIDQTGNVITSFGITPIVGVDDFNCRPSVAFDGSYYLVVYYRYGVQGSGVFGRRVSSAGGVVGTETTISGSGTNPTVAFNGSNYLVVWEAGTNIYGRRVSSHDSVIGPDFPICVAANEQANPSVTYDGTDFIIVWQDDREGDWGIYGARVDTSGMVVDTFTVVQVPRDQISPVINHGWGDQFLVTYSGWADFINGHPANTMRIWGILSEDVGIEEFAESLERNTGFTLDIYPTPIRNKCTIDYSVPRKASVNITIFDATGRLIRDFMYQNQDAGVYAKVIDISDLAQGVYFIRLNTDKNSAVQKVILLK